MPRYLIRRELGDVTEAQLEATAETSRRVREEDFPEVTWEHSHVIRTPAGLTSFCVYAAPDAQRVRDHAAAVGMPADAVDEIVYEVVP
jgi:hypothetical protein